MSEVEGTGEASTEAGTSTASSFLGGAQSGEQEQQQQAAEGQQEQQETDEQRVAREAEEARANETPEQKAEREAREALTADAPEEYADFTLPEGFELDAAVGDKLKALGKDANLSQARTQQLVELGAELAQSIVDKQAEGFTQLRSEWQTAARTDAEFGGTKFDESLTAAAKFRDAYGTPELTELLNTSGMGDHPEVIRLFARAGKAISDATFVNPGKAPTERALGEGFYSSMKKD